MGIHHMIVDELGRKGYNLPNLHSIILPYCLEYNLFMIEHQLKRMCAILG